MRLKLATSVSVLFLLSAVFYVTNAEQISLANLPEKMGELGKFLQSLQGRLDKSAKANPQIALIMRRTILGEITEKRAEIDAIDGLIRQVFESGTISRDDRVELELHLYNCDTFRALTDDIVKQIKQLTNKA